MDLSSGGVGRRQFLEDSMMMAGVAPLCCSTPAAPAESIRFEGSTLVLDLGKIPGLRATGSACAVVDEGRKLNLIVARPEARRFVALDRTCTHGGASCTYMHKRRTLRCTSLNHAEYSLDGTLLHGRTHGNLRAYRLRLNGPRLEIDLEKKA
jgi:nitrite reductase/ring-hydroxylating ferredoxin subunit